MNKAKYILKINEGVLVPKTNKNSTDIVRKIVIAISVILVFSWFVFKESIYSELSIFTKIFFLTLFFKYVILTSGGVDVPSPMEIIFYDEHFLVYRPRIWRGKNCIRRESDTIRYDQVTMIKYVSSSRRFHIYGTFSGKYYKYKKDNTLDDIPCYDKVVKDGMVFFSTRCTDEDDAHILEVLRTFMPSKIEINKIQSWISNVLIIYIDKTKNEVISSF